MGSGIGVGQLIRNGCLGGRKKGGKKKGRGIEGEGRERGFETLDSESLFWLSFLDSGVDLRCFVCFC